MGYPAGYASGLAHHPNMVDKQMSTERTHKLIIGPLDQRCECGGWFGEYPYEDHLEDPPETWPYPRGSVGFETAMLRVRARALVEESDSHPLVVAWANAVEKRADDLDRLVRQKRDEFLHGYFNS